MEQVKLSEDELAILIVLFQGTESFREGDTLSAEFKKVDNAKVHPYNYFGAKVFVGDDGESVVIIGKDIDKILYFVSGENEKACLVYKNMAVFQSDGLHTRFERMLEDSDSQYIFV